MVSGQNLLKIGGWLLATALSILVSAAVAVVFAMVGLGLLLVGYQRNRRGKQAALDTSPQPRLVVKGCFVKRNTIFKSGGVVGEPFEVACVLISNAVSSADPNAEARQITGFTEFLDENGGVVCQRRAIWAENDQFSMRPVGLSTEDLRTTDIPATVTPKTLEIAFRYQADGNSFYPYSGENYDQFRFNRNMDLRGPGPKLTNPTNVRLALAGLGVNVGWWDFALRVDAEGLQIEGA
jgi:hypothetical protein